MLELPNDYEYSPTLDAFTIYFNTLVYALQRLCGFSVKAFVSPF